MRRLILILICAFTLFPMVVKAQSANEQSEIKILTQRVDSLENELAYLKMSYELAKLKAGLEQLDNNVRIETLFVDSYAMQRIFLDKYWQLSLNKYEAYKMLLEGYKESIKSNRSLLSAYTLAFSNSNIELFDIKLDVLNDTLSLADTLYSQVEKSLERYQLSIDIYHDGL